VADPGMLDDFADEGAITYVISGLGRSQPDGMGAPS
jgi:hypothetical protein